MPARVFRAMTATVLRAMKDPEQGRYTPLTFGLPLDLDVIFLAAHQEVDAAGIPYGAPRPVAWVRKADVSDPGEGDTLAVTEGTYVVREFHNDGLDFYKLILSRNG